MSVISPLYCKENHVILLAETEEKLEIGFTEKTDEKAKVVLSRFYKNKEIVFKKLKEEEYSLCMSRLFSKQEETGYIEENDSDETNEEVNIEKIAEKQPVVNLLNSLILEALKRHASDIHIDSFVNGFIVRYRVSGLMENGMSLTEEEVMGLSVRLKVLSNLNVLERRKAQDGRLSVKSGNQAVDIRLSIVPTVYGESIVMRLLQTERADVHVEDLGFSEGDLIKIKKILTNKSGLILVTGPTGSGKTTTLNAFLSYLQNDEKKIISIEDPVEYRITGITQIQTDEEIGMSFSEILKRVLRQDPDIIMVGEIRDTETACLALQASLTGHLVFSSLHTNSPEEAPIRLKDMGAPSYMIKAVLKCVIGQELERRDDKKLHLLGKIWEPVL